MVRAMAANNHSRAYSKEIAMRGARICSSLLLLVVLLILAGSLDAAVAATLDDCLNAWIRCENNCVPYPPGSEASNYCHIDCATKQSVCISSSKSETSAQPPPPKKKTGLTPPPTGLMESGPGFSPTGPAATGGKRGTPSGGTGTIY